MKLLAHEEDGTRLNLLRKAVNEIRSALNHLRGLSIIHRDLSFKNII